MSLRATGTRPAALLAALVLSLGLAAIGCSGDDSDSPGASEVGSRRTTTTNPDEGAAAGDESELVAQSTTQVEVWDAPDDDDATSHVLSASSEPSGTLTFLVIERVDESWLAVQLPTPPAGSAGYVRTEDVSLSRHRYRIEVSRGGHALRVFAGEVEAITEPVGIGPDTPPTGTDTFIKELLIPPTGTPYGGHVYGLAGWTSTEQQFGLGAGVVAIHPADPATLGRDTPTGAIGVNPQVLTRLVDNIGLPLGTPVLIRD